MFDTIATTVLGPVSIAVVGWVLHRSLNKAKTDATKAEAESKTADAHASNTTAATQLLEAQRKSFETLLDPMREEITRLRSRVARVEELLSQEQQTRRHAVAFIRVLLTIVEIHAPDKTPEIPPAIADHL